MNSAEGTDKAMETTKGPWHYQEESDAYTHIIRGPNNEFIGSAPQGTKGEDEANSRLMAAAWEMREALRVALDFAEKEQDCREYSCLLEPTPEKEEYLTEASEAVDMIRAALAKAEAKS